MYQSVNPYNGEVLQNFDNHSDQEMWAAVAAAHHAFRGQWSRASYQQRSKILGAAATLLEARVEELATLATLEMGKSLTDITASNPAHRQEFFGPAAIVYSAKDEAEAVVIANDSPFGLGGSIYTPDIDRARRLASQIDSGMVFINHPFIGSPELPFGGIKRSGYGKELSGDGILE